MVDAAQLAADTAANVVVLILPALLWLFLYRFVWEAEPVARDIGFSRLTFWLLLLGGVIATVANLPILGVSGNVLAVNLGGALFPVLIALLVLYRAFGNRGLPVTLWLVGFVVAAGGAFIALLLLAGSSALPFAFVFALALPVIVLLAAPGVRPDDVGRRLDFQRATFALALTGGAVLFTFFTTETVPSVGIESAFPFYIIGPVVVGLLAVFLAGPVFHLPARFGMTIGYACATFGVLIGADLFRQPPLYATPGNIYSVGGAGALDLVALSGPMAMAAAFLLYQLYRKSDPPAPTPTYAASPSHLLNRALDAYVVRSGATSVQAAQQAARASALQSRRLLEPGVPEDAARPWKGLPVPGWVEGDQENLDALARSGTSDPREAYRGVQTARWMTRLGRDLTRPRYAGIMARSIAFGIDLGIVTAFGAAVWAAIVLWVGPDQALASVAFNAAVIGFASVAYVYFVASEVSIGTVGKLLLGLRVRDRKLGPPSLMEALVRNVPKLVPLTIIGYGGGIATAVFLGAGGAAASGALNALNGFLWIGLTLFGLGICGLVGAVAISMTSEHQRLGDYLAGTWVVNERSPMAPPAPVPVAGALGRYG